MNCPKISPEILLNLKCISCTAPAAVAEKDFFGEFYDGLILKEKMSE